MDFENAKENIQPLASGRNVGLLQASLSQDASQEISAQRKQLELDIKSYDGSDPLQPWYTYICWIEQIYPAGGSHSGIQTAIQKCLTHFEEDERYKQDRRFINLFIKFMEKQSDQLECYQQMYESGIGTMVADFYIAWAYCYDLQGNMRKANEIFRLGVECRAQPLEELKEAQHHFGYAVAQRMLYVDGEESAVVTQELYNRRQALCSLRSQKHKDTVTVGSVRTGAAIKSNKPGVLQLDGASTSRASRNDNRRHEVYNDENANNNTPQPASETQPPTNEKSSLRSIIDAARHQENLKEPIAWTKPHKHGKIFAATAAHDPGFSIHVDENALPPITKYKRNFDKPFQYPPNWFAKNAPQKPWITPVTIEDEPDANTLPCYNKVMFYPRPNMEFSPEEYRAYCWYKKRNSQHPYVLRNESWWGNNCSFGVRRYPNFASKSNSQQNDKDLVYLKPPLEESLKPLLNQIYNDQEQKEYQLEELLAAKWQLKRGVMDMEETVCLPGEQMPRRKSFFPTLHASVGRKSVLPRVSCVMEQDEDNEESKEEVEENTPEPAAIQLRKDTSSETATSTVAAKTLVTERFAIPAPPLRKIEIYEDDLAAPPAQDKPAATGFFDADETCSTQIFNNFLKLQAVSTPVAPQKQAPLRQFGTVLKAMPPVTPSEDLPVEAELAPTVQLLSPIQRKQLSTILETSEHGTHGSSGGTNATTKSTISSVSTSLGSQATTLTLTSKSETLLATPGPTRLQRQAAVTEEPAVGNFERLDLWEPNAPSVPLLKSLRFQEDKTETVPRPLLTCYQEDKTETLPKMPLTLPEPLLHQLTNNGSLLLQPTVPQIPTNDEDDLCGLFAKTPPKSKTISSPLYADFSKRICNQKTPDMFSKSKQTRQSTKCSFEIYDDNPPLSSPKRTENKVSNVSKLAESFMAELSFVPETQQVQEESSKVHVSIQNKFESLLNKPPTMPPPVVSLDMDYTLPKTQTEGMVHNLQRSNSVVDTVGPAHLTASFMKDCTDLRNCSTQLRPPNKVQSTVSQDKFEIFLDESMPRPLQFTSKDSTDLGNCSAQPRPANKVQSTVSQDKFEIFLDESMPRPLQFTSKDSTDLINCSAQLRPPNKAPVLQEKFDIFLDESMPPPPPLPSATMDYTLPETQPKQVTKQSSPVVIGKLDTIGPAHLTASFMKDCTELSRCQSQPSDLKDVAEISNRSTSTKLKFLREAQVESDNSTKQSNASKQSDNFFELNAATEMFASNNSMIKNSTLLPVSSVRSKPPMQPLESGSAQGNHSVRPMCIDNQLDNNDTIYYKSTPLTPKMSHSSWRNTSLSPKDNYEHPKPSINESVLNGTQAIAYVNPFSVDIISSLLDSIDFSLYIEKLPNCQLQGHVKRLTPHSTLEVAGEQFEVQKYIAKGAYGSIYRGIHKKSGNKVAFKQEKPTNYWEYYICLEVHSRLQSENMIPAYMSIDFALVGNNSSVYISEFSEYGSLICVCNKFKKHTNKNMDEYVVMHLCCQLLDIVDHLHALGIIHADIKADNFLLMKPLSQNPNDLSLQLVDFGVAIDTKLFAPNQTFDYVYNDDTFKCIEMRTKRPWTYQLDLFGLVGVMHVLLFGRYMEVTERPGGIWMPKAAFPRYFNRQAWESIFRTLLNIRDCRNMPNLQQLRALLKSELAEKEKFVESDIIKFNTIIQS